MSAENVTSAALSPPLSSLNCNDVILKKLNEFTIVNGRHRVTIIDTTEAWKSLYSICTSHHQTEVLHNDQKKCTPFQTFQDILEDEGNTTQHSEETDLPPHAEYEFVYVDKLHGFICEFCRKTTEDCRSNRHKCRICDGVYHGECLIQRGFCNDRLSREALSESTSIVGWSCPNCESLFLLLEEEEQEDIIEVFAQISGSDKVIDRVEFLQHQKEEYEQLVGIPMPEFREHQEEELFSKIDRNHTGMIDYWEFLPYMAVRFLSRRSTKDLLNLLTPKEIVNFKEFYKDMDAENCGSIPLSLAKQAYIEWYKSKVKEDPANYIDYQWYGGLKENFLLQSLKKSLSLAESGRDEDDCSIVDWQEYLKHCLLNILAARENTVSQKPLIPPMPSVLFTSRDKNKEEDDFLKLCRETLQWTNYLSKKGFK